MRSVNPVKIIVRLGLGLVIAAFAIQLIPYGHDHANPRVVQDAPWPDAATRAIAVRACYDCHSNETKWPWYTNIAPFSWYSVNHVEEGRIKANFSEWNQRHQSDLAEVVQEGSMPPQSYTLLHPNAKLSKAERDKLLAALKRFDGPERSRPPGDRGGGD